MPSLQDELQARGITFTNGFVSNPVCCPTRATILTGLYSGHNGVWSNKQKWSGGWKTFHDLGDENHTVATVLHGAGYYTGLVGKYLNEYEQAPSWVPPGWDVWNALTGFSYYGPTESVQGQTVHFPDSEYQTDILGQQAVDFIRSAPPEQPLFLYWAPHAPHLPATPLKKDVGTLKGQLQPWRPPNYNEQDVSDKPWFIQKVGLWDAAKQKHWDAVREKMYESLIDVDRWVGNIVNALREAGRLDNTLIVFTSDNGFMLGEHRWTGKATPYEESIRVPWIVRWDAANFPEASRTDDHLMVDTDFATTFAEVAGTSMGSTDGLDFASLAGDPGDPWRTTFLTEHGGPVRNGNAFGTVWCGVRSLNFSYAQYWNRGFEELYDLRDPYQMTNVASFSGYQNALQRMRGIAHKLCDPLPPGFHFTH